MSVEQSLANVCWTPSTLSSNARGQPTQHFFPWTCHMLCRTIIVSFKARTNGQWWAKPCGGVCCCEAGKAALLMSKRSNMFHGFPMDFPWISYGFLMDFSWISHGFPWRQQALTCAHTFQRMEKCLAAVFSQIGGCLMIFVLFVECEPSRFFNRFNIRFWGQTFGLQIDCLETNPGAVEGDHTDAIPEAESHQLVLPDCNCWWKLE